jgi:hypothetical protein
MHSRLRAGQSVPAVSATRTPTSRFQAARPVGRTATRLDYSERVFDVEVQPYYFLAFAGAWVGDCCGTRAVV